MKNGKGIFLSAAVILGAAGMMLGNHVLAAGALAAGNQTELAIIMPEAASAVAMQFPDVGMYANSDGVVYLASENRSKDVQKQEEARTTTKGDSPEAYQNPTDGNLSEEEAKQVGIKAIAEKFELTAEELNLFDVTIRARYSAPFPTNIVNMMPSFTVEKESLDTDMDTRPTSEAYNMLWLVRLTPINQQDYPAIEYYATVFADSSLELMNVHAIPLIKEGTPLKNELTAAKAQELAIAAIVEKYALTEKTLDKFTVTTKYYEVTDETPGKHAWWVSLYPTDNDDFSEIGCYWTYLDAETREVLQMNSAADGKG